MNVQHIQVKEKGDSGSACVEMALKNLLSTPERCSQMLQESSSTVRQETILQTLAAQNVMPIDLAYYLYMMRVPTIMTTAVLGPHDDCSETDAARLNKLFRIAPEKHFPVTRRFVAVNELKSILTAGHTIIALVDGRYVRYVRVGELLSTDDSFSAPPLLTSTGPQPMTLRQLDSPPAGFDPAEVADVTTPFIDDVGGDLQPNYTAWWRRAGDVEGGDADETINITGGDDDGMLGDDEVGPGFMFESSRTLPFSLPLSACGVEQTSRPALSDIPRWFRRKIGSYEPRYVLLTGWHSASQCFIVHDPTAQYGPMLMRIDVFESARRRQETQDALLVILGDSVKE